MTSVSDLSWTTMTGRVVRLGDMTDAHIANALTFVKKLHNKWMDEAAAAASPGLCSSDSMASYHAGEAMDYAFDKADYYKNWVRAFEAMQKIRTSEEMLVHS